MRPLLSGYLFNLTNRNIELHFDGHFYNTLTEEQKAALKSAYTWSCTYKCWISRAKEPHLEKARNAAKLLGFEEREHLGYF